MAEFVGPQETLDPKAGEVARVGRRLKGVYINDKSLLDEAGALRAMQDEWSDQSITLYALDAARASAPNFSRELQFKVAKDKIDLLKRERDRVLGSRLTALHEAVQRGAANLPDDVMYTPEQRRAMESGQPYKLEESQAARLLAKEAEAADLPRVLLGDLDEKLAARFDTISSGELRGSALSSKPEERGVIGDIIYGIGATSRPGQAARAGSLKAQLEGIRGQPLEQGEGETKTIRAPFSRFAQAPMSYTIRKEAPLTIGGKPAEEALDAAPGQAEKAVEFGVARGKQTGLPGMESGPWTSGYDLSSVGQEWQTYLQGEANKLTQQKYADLPEEQRAAKAKEIYGDLVRGLPGKLRDVVDSPNLSQFLYEVVMDPLNLVNPVAVASSAARAVGKAASKVPGVAAAAMKAGKAVSESAVAGGARAVRDAFTANRAVAGLRRAAAKADDPALRAQLESAADAAETTAAKSDVGAQHMSEIVRERHRATVAGMTNDEKQMLIDVGQNQRALEELPPAAREKIATALGEHKATMEIARQHGVDTNYMRRFEGDILTESGKIDEIAYFPQPKPAQMTPDQAAELAVAGRVQEQATSGAAKRRVKDISPLKGEEIDDAVKHYVGRMRKGSALTAEVKGLHEVATSHGMWMEFERPISAEAAQQSGRYAALAVRAKASAKRVTAAVEQSKQAVQEMSARAYDAQSVLDLDKQIAQQAKAVKALGADVQSLSADVSAYLGDDVSGLSKAISDEEFLQFADVANVLGQLTKQAQTKFDEAQQLLNEMADVRSVAATSATGKVGVTIKQRDNLRRLFEGRQAKLKKLIAQGDELNKREAFFKDLEGLTAEASQREAAREAKRGELVAAKSKELGVPMVKLAHDSSMGQVVQRVTGTPGVTFRGTKDIYVPQPVAERLRDILPFIDNPAVAANSYNKVMDRTLRPFMSLYRRGITSLNLGFSFVNLAGAVPMAIVSQGFRALNPKLQGGAILASIMAGTQTAAGRAWAAKIPYRLRGGQLSNLNEILGIAESLGLVARVKQVTALHRLGSGALNVATLGAPAAARITENYQHLIAFMGFLDGLEPRQVQKAFALANKWSGNYRNLSKLERTFMSDATLFYGWNRFIVPWFMRALKEHPERVAAFVKYREYENRKNPLPITQAALPGYLRDFAIGAEKEMQPPLDPDMPEAAELFAVKMMQDPLTMGLSLLASVGATNEAGGMRGGSAASQLSPLVRAGVEIFTGRDMLTGEEIPGWNQIGAPAFSWQFLSNARQTAIGRLLSAPIARPTETFLNMVRLHVQAGQPEVAVQMWQKYAAGRQVGALNEPIRQLANAVTGEDKPQQAIYGNPAFQYHVVSPLQSLATQKREGSDTLKRLERQLSR